MLTLWLFMSKKLFTDGRTDQNYSSEPHQKDNWKTKWESLW